MVELLAPAGELDSGFAAFAYGADAVYLGLNKFSARAEAVNFTPDDLKFFTSYAHSLGKRVLVAVNTLIFDDEFRDLAETLYDIGEAKADGVIVQDLGVARFAKRNFPTLRLHASTQMAAHNEQGARALKDLGFKRVVLARELTFDEIANIAKRVPVEIETFVHGALCYSYSGLCMFSSIYTGRSANRGKCVYPCRESVCFDGERGFAFSMRDLSLQESVRRLKQAGVAALKIEGRKKTPLYTAAVTDLYRNILDGTPDKALIQSKKDAVRTIFSRLTTTLYTQDRQNGAVADVETTGHRGLPVGSVEKAFSHGGRRFIQFKPSADFARYDGLQIDLENAPKPFGFSAETLICGKKNVFEAKAGVPVAVALPDNAPYIAQNRPVYLSSSTAVKKAYPFTRPDPRDFAQDKIPVDVTVVLSENELFAQAGEQTASLPATLTAAQNAEAVEKNVRRAFEKSGESRAVLGDLTLVNAQNLFAPVSALNDLRRNLYAKIDEDAAKRARAKRTAVIENALKNTAQPAASVAPARKLIVKTDDARNLQALSGDDLARLSEIVFEILPDRFSPPDLLKEKLRFALPAVCRAWESEKMRRIVADLKAAGFAKWEIGNVWGLDALDVSKDDVSADATLYAANVQAAKMLCGLGLTRFTVAQETPAPEKIFEAFPDKALGIAYQDTALFISETCPRKTLHGACLKCGGDFNLPLSSRYGKFEAVGRACRFRLLSERPHLKIDEMLQANARLIRADFVCRKPDADRAVKTIRTLCARLF